MLTFDELTKTFENKKTGVSNQFRRLAKFAQGCKTELKPNK